MAEFLPWPHFLPGSPLPFLSLHPVCVYQNCSPVRGTSPHPLVFWFREELRAWPCPSPHLLLRVSRGPSLGWWLGSWRTSLPVATEGENGHPPDAVSLGTTLHGLQGGGWCWWQGCTSVAWSHHSTLWPCESEKAQMWPPQHTVAPLSSLHPCDGVRPVLRVLQKLYFES